MLLSFSFSHFVLYFMVYSVLGWICESLVCSIKRRRPTSRGILAGPYLPSYGIAALVTLLAVQGLQKYWPLVFLVAGGIGILFKYLVSWSTEKFLGARLWDYSGERFSLGGRVHLWDLPLFGGAGLVLSYLVQPLVQRLLDNIQPESQRVLGSLLLVLWVIDLIYNLGSFYRLLQLLEDFEEHSPLLAHYQEKYQWMNSEDPAASTQALREICENDKENPAAEDFLKQLDKLDRVPKKGFRILLAYPTFQTRKGEDLPFAVSLREFWEQSHPVWKGPGRFFRQLATKLKALTPAAGGITVYQLVWVFTVASVLGFFLETINCYVTRGVIESRQGMLYGPFNQVYGFGAVFMVLLLHPLAKKWVGWLFLASALVGGAFEYACSWVQEAAFGTLSWEYSNQKFSVGGRTSLKLMIIWGLLGVVYIRIIYPKLVELINSIPKKQGVFFAWVLAVTLSANLLLSGMAVERWAERQQGVPATSSVARFLDKNYPNQMLDEIYPNMELASQAKSPTSRTQGKKQD